MNLLIRKNSPLRKLLGPVGTEFLQYGVEGLTRILTHVETSHWRIEKGPAVSSATFRDSNRRVLNLLLALNVNGSPWRISGFLERKRIPGTGVGSISRTIDLRERNIVEGLLNKLGAILGTPHILTESLLSALRRTFDEQVVSEHLIAHHKLEVQLGDWFAALRRLAEQTYENKSVAFGCVIHVDDTTAPPEKADFPNAYLQHKKYRALSDGYRTAYRVSSKGALLGFTELVPAPHGRRFYPEWCEGLAAQSRSGNVGLALTRQGDIIVLDSGHLTFTYRFGKWQYWNHTHVVDLIRNAARVQHVPPKSLSGIARSIYCAALDVSFRRSGGLFVLLRSPNWMNSLIPMGDAIGDDARDPVDKLFDTGVSSKKVTLLERCLLTEISGLDGAVVLGNNGDILAYGAILEPRKRGRIHRVEGSRTKAAIGASNYGLAVKISSDGEITVYLKGKKLLSF